MSFIATAVVGIGGAAAGAGLLGTAAATALGGSAVLGGLAGMAVGGGIGGAMDAKSAANKAQSMVNNLQYQPIDLNKLQEQAQGFAEQNIAKSLELEKTYLPGVAAARTGLQHQVAQDLMRGGNLPTDVSNQVTKASMAQAGTGGFGAGPLTAAQLGLSAYDMRTQAQQRANAFLQSNPLPTSGIDPGSLASAAIGQSNAQNQFNLSKAGAQANILQSQGRADAAMGGAIAGGLGSIAAKFPMSGGGNFGGGFSTPTYGNIPATASSIGAGLNFGGGLTPSYQTGGYSSTLLPITTKTTGF